jgi:hypothetical protein
MVTQNDLFQSTEDALLAERLMKLDISKNFQGMFRTPNQYVNSDRIAEILVAEVGYRNIIDFCVTTLERRIGN